VARHPLETLADMRGISISLDQVLVDIHMANAGLGVANQLAQAIQSVPSRITQVTARKFRARVR
jgi:hypothetical protein